MRSWSGQPEDLQATFGSTGAAGKEVPLDRLRES